VAQPLPAVRAGEQLQGHNQGSAALQLQLQVAEQLLPDAAAHTQPQGSSNAVSINLQHTVLACVLYCHD
jgi:hypothetical protein